MSDKFEELAVTDIDELGCLIANKNIRIEQLEKQRDELVEVLEQWLGATPTPVCYANTQSALASVKESKQINQPQGVSK